MTTDVIVTSDKNAIAVNSAGTLVGHAVTQGSSVNRTDGYFTSAGNAVEIRLGFDARKVTIFNETDAIRWEKLRGMAAANTIKTTFTGPVVAKDTGSAILIGAAGSRVVTLSAALVGTAKNIVFHIED